VIEAKANAGESSAQEIRERAARERVAFESWFKRAHWHTTAPLPRQVGAESKYELGFMQMMWLGWYARSVQRDNS